MLQDYQKRIIENAPLLQAAFEEHRHTALRAYLHGINKKTLGDIEDSRDVWDVVTEYLTALFPKELAEKTADIVDRQRCILTANHHEVEFCVQSVQGNMLYEYWLWEQGEREGIVPIFSNTTVNMSNTNFPRGMLIYHKPEGGMPVKIPVFPFKCRNSMIAAADGFDEKMVHTAMETANREMRKGNLSGQTRDTVYEIFQEVYLSNAVLSQKKYSLQIGRANQILSSRYITDGISRHIYIELETISSMLIKKDLKKENSLLSFLLWNEDILQKLFLNLLGKTGCWDGQGQGTFLFWGVDGKQRRFSLKLLRTAGQWEWNGTDMNGQFYRIPFTKESILENLHKGSIVPCLFLTFFEIGFVRDYTLIGGCFQKTYLNAMLEGLIHTLEYAKGWEREIEILRKKESHYLSGPMFLLRGKGETTYPVGSVELWEKPLTRQELKGFMETNMARAHEIGIFNFYIDLIPKKEQSEDEWKKIAKSIADK